MRLAAGTWPFALMAPSTVILPPPTLVLGVALLQMLALLEVETFEQGQKVITEGEEGNKFYIIEAPIEAHHLSPTVLHCCQVSRGVRARTACAWPPRAKWKS